MAMYICKVSGKNDLIYDKELEADSMADIVDQLTSSGEVLISAKKQSGLNMDVGEMLGIGGGIKPKELIFFTKQLRIMLESGIPILQSLEAMSRTVESKGLKKVMTELMTDIREGIDLYTAFGKHPKVFSGLYLSMLKAGESAGILPHVLNELEKIIIKDFETRKAVKKALRYPAFVFTILFISMANMIAFVIPKMMGSLIRSGGEIPLPTKIMLMLSDILLDYGLILLVVIGAIVGGVVYYFKTEKGEYVKDRIKLKLPVFNKLIRTSAMARFTRTLSVLLNSGVTLNDSLMIARDVMDNRIFIDKINEVDYQLKEGIPLNVAMQGGNIFPKDVQSMVAIGEDSGNLAKMLESVAMFYDVELDERVDGLSAAVEPIITVVIGAFVAFFVASVFLPIFSSYDAVK